MDVLERLLHRRAAAAVVPMSVVAAVALVAAVVAVAVGILVTAAVDVAVLMVVVLGVMMNQAVTGRCDCCCGAQIQAVLASAAGTTRQSHSMVAGRAASGVRHYCVPIRAIHVRHSHQVLEEKVAPDRNRIERRPMDLPDHHTRAVDRTDRRHRQDERSAGRSRCSCRTCPSRDVL